MTNLERLANEYYILSNTDNPSDKQTDRLIEIISLSILHDELASLISAIDLLIVMSMNMPT